ncbi:prolyl endopeptidase-like [Planococcus citri]|uniref:prolyl endopeptidase-like n=1 Tax=Planococcus citri TaxID=170843 RepID=UPI0031F866B1
MAGKLFAIEIFLILLIGNTHVHGVITGSAAPSVPSSKYPDPRRDDSISNTYPKDTIVKDPYQWMEAPDSDETKKFVEDENRLTREYLDKSPYRAELEARYKELYDYHRYNGFFQEGKKYFSYQNTGLQNQDVLYVQDSLTSKKAEFFNPNTLSEDGTVALDPYYSAFSEDGSIFAYMLRENGSDWSTVQFKNVDQDDKYHEKLEKIKFSVLSWTNNNKGLFYSAYLDHKGNPDGSTNDSNQNHKIYYHLLGDDQSKDVLAVEFPSNSEYLLTGWVSDDANGKYLVVSVADGTGNNMIYIADLEKINFEIKGKLELIPVVTNLDANYEYIANDGNTFIFKTSKDADNYKIISVDISNPDPKAWIWKDIVPNHEKNVLEWAVAASDVYLIVCYTENVKSTLQLHNITSGELITTFDLKDIGTVEQTGFFGGRKYSDIFFLFKSFLTPGIIYRCDLSKPSFDLEVFQESKLTNFNREDFTTEQVFYKSTGGVEVPMFLTYRKTLEKNGNNPTFLIGYGGFGESQLPYFSVNRIVFMSNFNGIHAMANIRGGGEYGEQWHRDGSVHNKQNSFDDFKAGAQYLIDKQYTSTKLMTINGGSNGGLLMGACLNQRPDLFGVVVADVGVFDMLRFDQFTIGKNWIPEYGSPSTDEDFEYLYAYSPLHNVKIPDDPHKQYPPVMLTTSDHDDRVPPFHSLKFIATLQYNAKKHSNQINPFIIRIEKKAGHGDGLPTDKAIARLVDMNSFIIMNTGITFHA